MSAASELTRIRRDLASLEEEIGIAMAPRSRTPLSDGERRSIKSDLQELIQRLDELTQRLAK